MARGRAGMRGDAAASTSTSGERPGAGSSTVPPSTISRSTPTARSTAPWRKTASLVSTGHTLPRPVPPGQGCVGRGVSGSDQLRSAPASDGGCWDGAGRGGGEGAPASPAAQRCPGAVARRGSGAPQLPGLSPPPLVGLGETSPRHFGSRPAGSPGPHTALSAPCHPPAPSPGAGGLHGAVASVPGGGGGAQSPRGRARPPNPFSFPSSPRREPGTCPAHPARPVTCPRSTGCSPNRWATRALASPGAVSRCPLDGLQPALASLVPPQLVSRGGFELPRAKSHLSPLTCARDRR